MRVFLSVFTGCAVLLACTIAADAHWVTKSGYEDYAQHMVGVPPQSDRTDGMPDFDQKQDGWMNQFQQWNWCGPVAVGNCLWWFDSKFETIKCISLPPGTLVRPPAISDHYSLVHSIAGLDDHDPANVIPFITLLGNQVPGGVGAMGITPQQMKQMIENYLSLPQVDLFGHYSVRIIWMPTYAQIYTEIEQSQDVITLVGFYQMDPNGMWFRFGGHYLTVAGVDTQNAQQWISFSDPYRDNAEMGGLGAVHNGWLIPHVWPPVHLPHIHNDAGNVSHDVFRIFPSNSPGGVISPGEFGADSNYAMWENFIGQNFSSSQFAGPYNPNLPVHVELEALVVICPNFDYGDLGANYPTIDIESCGPAHPLSDKAWLGDCIDAELQPKIYDLDNCDDGITFHNLPWHPHYPESVSVFVATGAHYAGESLFLNAWKDGNIDGDFDDDSSNADLWCNEWIIQDAPVAPGWSTHDFCDPGFAMLGPGNPYDLILRFRLTSQPVGRYGYGGYWGQSNNGLGTYDIDWVLGEVEDYDSTDMQLAVELESFAAIAGDACVDLVWVTASESDINYFSLTRSAEGSHWSEIARVTSHGNSADRQHYAFRDEQVENECLYTYGLTAVNIDGSSEILSTAQALPHGAPLPLMFALGQNYPNPFNASTEIRFALPMAQNVTLNVYNASGQLVRTLVNAYVPAGEHVASFDAPDLASGIYLYRLQTATFTQTRKMVLLK